jgi:hypothetical protein
VYFICCFGFANNYATGQLTNSMEQSPSWEAKTVKKFPTFYRTRRFIVAFTRVGRLLRSWATIIQCMPPSHFLKIHFNIIVSFTPRSSKWCFSLRFSHQTPVCTSPLPRICCIYKFLLIIYLAGQWFENQIGLKQHFQKKGLSYKIWYTAWNINWII